MNDLEHQRNNLATEFRQVYPRAVSELVSLFARASALDQKLSELHQSRPSGSKGQLLDTELVARNLTEYSRDEPPLSRSLALPDWSEPSRLAWPPREMPASVMLSESIAQVHDRRRHSADWAAALKEETEQRKLLEQQRVTEEEQHTAQQKRDYERSLSR